MIGYQWEGWRCRMTEGKDCPTITAVLILGSGDEALLDTLAVKFPAYCLIGVCPPDWNDCCTPWPAPGLRKKDRPFGGGAGASLSVLTNRILPWARSQGHISPPGTQLMLAGYSLAGLTSLYGLYQGLPFGRYASLSGSLWYPGWTEYALQGTAAVGAKVYLSLGKDEPHSRHPLLRTVGEATEATRQIIGNQLGNDQVCLQWNEGGHFTGYGERYEKALQWAQED